MVHCVTICSIRANLARAPASIAPLFFFNDTATTEIYTLSLHDALPIGRTGPKARTPWTPGISRPRRTDRKSTRLNSSHVKISYAVFCLKKKKMSVYGFEDEEQNGVEPVKECFVAEG